MSYSIKDGKDEIHFVTKEDLKYITSDSKTGESTTHVDNEVHEQYPGAVSPDGEINWDCPCLGGLGSEGPCVEEFRSAFSCWLNSTAEEKGEDCVDNFFAMSGCMQENQEYYDDLNERNKAAAAEAQARFDEEEKSKLQALEQEQLAIQESALAQEQLEIQESAEVVNTETELTITETTEPETPLIETDTTETLESPVSDEVNTETIENSVSDEVNTERIESSVSIPLDTLSVSDKLSDVEPGFGTQSSLIVAASADEEEESQKDGDKPCDNSL